MIGWANAAMAAGATYSGPFYMCPDAHGAEQKALFRLIDITQFPMRIEGRGSTRVDGYGAQVMASRSAAIAGGRDPIEEAFEKLFSEPEIKGTENKKTLAAVCFATTPPPKEDVDGPFVFMPGFLNESGELTEGPRDSVLIPAQTYLVLTFSGDASEVGNMRFTLSEQFWPRVAPFLGLERADGPNLMIWLEGSGTPDGPIVLEMWTPIKPLRINPT
jgi:predicted transcriptional regulator YdeE